MSRDVETDSSSSSILHFNLIDIVSLLKRRWLPLAFGMAVGLALGISYYATATIKYESSAQILVMRKDPRMATRVTEASDQTESSVSEDVLATHIQILQSPEIVRLALREGKFDELPSIVEKLGGDQTPVDFIVDRLTVTRGGVGQSRLAHVLNISLRHTSEIESKEILLAIINSYRAFLGAKFQDVSQEAAGLITKAKVELAAELKKAEDEYRTFRQTATLLFKGDEGTNIHRVRFEELQSAISSSRLKTSTAKARLEVVEQAIQEQDLRNATDVERLALLDQQDFERLSMLINVEKGDANTAEFQSTQPLRLELARAQHDSFMKLLLQEKSLSADLGADHPQLEQLRNQIAMARTFFEDQRKQLGDVEKKPRLTAKVIVEAYRELLRQDLITLTKHQAAVEQLAEQESAAAKKLVADELRGEALRQDVERVQVLYDTVLERLREINLVKDYAGFVTEIIAPVETGVRVSPRLLLALLGGTVLGLAFGGVGVGIAELRDRTFHSLDALRAAVDMPLLSTIPRFALKVEPDDAAKVADPQRSPCLVTYYRSRSREAEVFRGLRTSLLFAARDGQKQVVACSSPAMGDGKSTVLANLAISIAQSGKRVLLVDCDLRRPNVHQLFHLENRVGLVEIVSGKIDPPDATHSTDVENLSLITSGLIPPNPAELLSSAAFEQFIDTCRDRYDFVLLDCPPVLAVSDPCIVAHKADFVVIVVNLKNNTRPQVLRTQEMLREVGAPAAGFVVNGVEETHRTGYDRYAYGYGYGYGNQSDPSSRYYTTAATTDAAASVVGRDAALSRSPSGHES